MSARSKVLETAWRRWGAGEDLSVAALSAGSGVSNGSIYHHFGAKDGVLAAMLLDALGGYHDEVLAVLASHAADPEGGVRALVALHLRFWEHETDKARLLQRHRDAVMAGPHAGELRTLNLRMLTAVDTWLGLQADAGHVPPTPVEVAYALVFAPAQELSRLWLAGRVRTTPTTHTERLGAAAWAALRAQEAA